MLTPLRPSLLEPVGYYRREHVKPSKGKRSAKADNAAKKSQKHTAADMAVPPPELISKMDVGLHAITRNLETRSGCEAGDHTSPPAEKGDTTDEPYSMIFVTRGDQSSAFNCHFPRMVAAASKDIDTDSRTRLVGFSKPCSERLSKCLNIARVSSIALSQDAPGSKALWDFVREKVETIDASWLEKSKKGSYHPTQINSIETTVGQKKMKKA